MLALNIVEKYVKLEYEFFFQKIHCHWYKT